MADPHHLSILQEGVAVWNAWRADHPDVRPDLSGEVADGELDDDLHTLVSSVLHMVVLVGPPPRAGCRVPTSPDRPARGRPASRPLDGSTLIEAHHRC